MKRVLMLNYEFPPLGGGGGVLAHRLAKGLVAEGYAVDYLTSGYAGLPAHEQVDGIDVYRVRVIGRTAKANASMISMLTYPPAALLQGIRLCRRHRYAFINTQFVIPTGPLGFALSRLFGIRNVVSIHGGDIYDPSKRTSPHRHWYLRAAVRFLLNRADAIVAQSSDTRRNCLSIYRPDKDVAVIPIAYAPERFPRASRRELGMEEGATYLIGLGRLVPRKDFPSFVRALAALPDVRGIILGGGPEHARLLALAEELGVADRLLVTGHYTDAQRAQYLGNADLFVLTSLHEGFGIMLQEAMDAGLPIVATNHGGQVDLVEEGVNGLLVPPSDHEALVAAIRKALSTGFPDPRPRLASFDPSRIARAYLAL